MSAEAAQPVMTEVTEKQVLRASEYAMLDVLIAASDLQMHVFQNMREDLDKREVDQDVVDFYQKALYAACGEYVSAYETLHGGAKEEVTESES